MPFEAFDEIDCAVKNKLNEQFEPEAKAQTDGSKSYFVATIPDEDIESALRPIVTEAMKKTARTTLERVQTTIKNCSGMSAEQVRAWQKQYNDINNEGEEGYIPHRVSLEECAAARKTADECEKVLKNG